MTSRLAKKVGKDRLLAVKDVLNDVEELLQGDLDSLYAEMTKEPDQGDWATRQAILIGEVKSTKNLIKLIHIGE